MNSPAKSRAEQWRHVIEESDHWVRSEQLWVQSPMQENLRNTMECHTTSKTLLRIFRVCDGNSQGRAAVNERLLLVYDWYLTVPVTQAQ